MSVLDLFHDATKGWFESDIGKPTAVQEEAWPAIARGEHTLVSAPTGTGKTLSAFLVFLDKFKRKLPGNELQLIYISPLKALATDISENLFRPLNGIFLEEQPTVAIRTGDTTQRDRRAMIKTPPNILITTPESLYLLLSSKSGKDMLKTARAIIIDELHAMIDSKRGAHMMLSLARLDTLCEQPLQRIGLSATIEPLALAAEYLSSSGAVTIAAPAMEKKIKISVISPAKDMNNLSAGTIWNDLAQAVYDQCTNTRSVIAFVEGRMYSEKLAYYVNLVAGDANFARTHHGCVSKEQRFEAENDLRSGRLRLMCATSSMELGIDVGEIDRVLQIGYPRKISSVMQRLGRAGHNPGRTSVMIMFPRTVAESLQCGLTAHTAGKRCIERSKPPRLCLDVLSQHLVSMSLDEGYTIDEALKIIKSAYPFRDINVTHVTSLLEMLAGDYEHKRDLPVRPRLLYDRINGRVEGDAYSRMLAVSAGGTIPDTGMFAVKSEGGQKLGELDEEFVYEARVGDKFLLGSFAWKITQLTRDTVMVAPTNFAGAQPPFWRNVWMSRALQTSIEFGKLLRGITEATDLMAELQKLGLDDFAAENLLGLLDRQLNATGILPDDRTIIAEYFADEAGDNQVMLHSIFGRQINAPLSVLLQAYLAKNTKTDAVAYEDDDGILLMARNNAVFPSMFLKNIEPESAGAILEASLISSSLFNIAFRHNAARALMMGVSKGKRNPLWVQRLRAAEFLDSVAKFPDHPLIRETKRECLEDFWDLPGLQWLLRSIQSGAIQIRELHTEYPSPMSLPLRRAAEASLMYEYFPSTMGINVAATEALKEAQMIKPATDQLAQVLERKKLPTDEKQLHSLLMMEGDVLAGELPLPYEWFEDLAKQGRAMYVEPGLWIAAEQEEDYKAGISEDIIRRTLRYKGAHYPEQVAERYCIPEEEATQMLSSLKEEQALIEDNGLYYHADLYERARHATIAARRRQIKTVKAENYAAMLAGRLSYSAPPDEQLKRALHDLCDKPYPIASWESTLLPARVNNYRTDILNKYLSSGEMFYRITEIDKQIHMSFHFYKDIDYDSIQQPELSGDEEIIYSFLQKRGASFSASFASVLEGRSAHDSLLSLLGKGIIHSDSFIPVQQWLARDKQSKSVKQRINARVIAETSGRWEINRPLKARTKEQHLERIFDKTPVLCRETYKHLNESNISWHTMLETLRIWEYTGQVRRGYFVEGLSGMQYIHEKNFDSTISALEHPQAEEIIWLPTSDPLQAWGKYIPHKENKDYTQTSTSAVALQAGTPTALLEKSGKTLKILNNSNLSATLNTFIQAYNKKQIFHNTKKITIKTYPQEANHALKNTGFTKIMSDWCFYRG